MFSGHLPTNWEMNPNYKGAVIIIGSEFMSEIYFIRHAQASFKNDNYDRLSSLGFRQAQILGEYFACLGLKFDAVYAGTMKRQIDTAKAVLSRMSGGHFGLKLQRKSAFNEYDFAAILKSQIPLMIDENPTLAESLPRMYSDRQAFQELFEHFFPGYSISDVHYFTSSVN